MKARRPTPRAGFTLVEIMLVVAIFGLTLMIGIPSFVNMREKRGMRKAQSDLQEVLRDTRRQAIMTGEPAKLVFHPLDGTYEGGGFQGALPADVTVDIMGVNFVECEHADLAEVHFFPNGTSDEFTIVLHGANGEMTKISLEPITALAQVELIR